MPLEDYFDFFDVHDIRLKGTRVGIETILYDFIHRGRPPEEIARHYPSVTLEQVYATITYYLHKQEELNAYLTAWIEHGRQMRREQALHPTPAMLRLRRMKAEREAGKSSVP